MLLREKETGQNGSPRHANNLKSGTRGRTCVKKIGKWSVSLREKPRKVNKGGPEEVTFN